MSVASRSATRTRPICIAHRGASGSEPENTVRAFRRALALGATWLELDVHHVHDRLLVIHDPTLDRTTDGTGALGDHPLTDLRALDAGAGERIPLLEEVLDLVRGRARLNIELKHGDSAAPVVEVLRREVAAGTLQPQQFVLSSFVWDQLKQVRQLEPEWPVAPLADKGAGGELLEVAERLQAEAIHISRWSARARFVQAARQRGLAVRVYTVNREWEFDLMQRLGVDAFFTDHPQRALAWGAAAPALA